MIGDTILQATPIESDHSRQTAKINYLQNENKFLQDYVKDLEHVVQVNKEALKIMSTQCYQVGSRSKCGSQNDTTTSIMENRNSPESKKNFYAVYEQLQDENSRLLVIIEKLKQDRAVAQTRALLSEQIAEEAERREMETRAELEEKILELRKMVQDKEYFIQELEKLKPMPDQEGVVVKYREVMEVTEQNLRLHEELISYKAMLVKVAKEFNKLKQEKGELNETNIKLASELAKIKSVMAHPVAPKHNLKVLIFDKVKEVLNRSHFRNHSPSNSPLKFPEGSSLISPRSPMKSNKADSHTLKPSLFKRPDLTNKRCSSPYRTTNIMYDMKLLEKIEQLESELETTKNVLTRETMNNKSLSDELDRLRRGCRDILATNEVLCKSNKRYQEKWDKLFQAMEFYKEFYLKYVDMITSSKNITRSSTIEIPNAETLNKINEAFNLELDSEKITRKSSDSKLETKQEEAEKEKQKEADHAQKEKSIYEFTKDQSKAYLLSLAKDLKKDRHNHPKRLVKQQGPKLNKTAKIRRSLSNPLDYVMMRKKHIYEPLPGDQRKAAIRDNIEKRRRTMEINRHLENQKIAESFEAGLNIEEHFPNRVRRSLHHHSNNQSFSMDTDDLEVVKDNELSFISSNNEIFDL